MSTEELGAAFFPGTPEAWATPTALTPFPDLAPAPTAQAGIPHPALIPHHPAALAQMPIRVSITSYIDLLACLYLTRHSGLVSPHILSHRLSVFNYTFYVLSKESCDSTDII